MVENEENYLITGFMINELKLKGNELMAYSIIWGKTQGVNDAQINLDRIAELMTCSSEKTAKAISSLEKNRLIHVTKISEKDSVYSTRGIN
jgi:hypothetical protein